MNNAIIGEKLEKIESELYNLKSMVIKLMQQPGQNKVVKLKGLLKGITVNEKDIEEAKRSLFKGS